MDTTKQDTCPNCGYCPHRGRSAAPSYPIYPWIQRPWGRPPITWTVTSTLNPLIGNTTSFDPSLQMTYTKAGY